MFLGLGSFCMPPLYSSAHLAVLNKPTGAKLAAV